MRRLGQNMCWLTKISKTEAVYFTSRSIISCMTSKNKIPKSSTYLDSYVIIDQNQKEKKISKYALKNYK